MLASAIPKSPSDSLSRWRSMPRMGRPLLGGPFLPGDRLNDLLILILPPCGVDRGFAARPTSHGQLHHSTRGQGMPPTGRAPSHSTSTRGQPPARNWIRSSLHRITSPSTSCVNCQQPPLTSLSIIASLLFGRRWPNPYPPAPLIPVRL